jgi:hypothetical protein
MPRFVLLYHHCPPHYERPSHWDLMLEAGQMLRTWSLPQLPCDWKASRTQTAASYPDCPPIADGNTISAEQLGDHRLDYLEKEGRLTGDRGAVSRIDAGTYDSEAKIPDRWTLTLAGGNWTGRITLQQTVAGGSRWMLTVLADDE